MRRVGNIITRYPNITYQSFLFSTRGGERDIREFHRDEKIKRWESIIFHRATAMAALNPVYAEIHRRYDRFFALFFTDSLLFISLPPFPSHSFCHRFIFLSPAPSTAVYEQYKASRGQTHGCGSEMADISGTRRFVSKCARKLHPPFSWAICIILSYLFTSLYIK